MRALLPCGHTVRVRSMQGPEQDCPTCKRTKARRRATYVPRLRALLTDIRERLETGAIAQDSKRAEQARERLVWRINALLAEGHHA